MSNSADFEPICALITFVNIYDSNLLLKSSQIDGYTLWEMDNELILKERDLVQCIHSRSFTLVRLMHQRRSMKQIKIHY